MSDDPYEGKAVCERCRSCGVLGSDWGDVDKATVVRRSGLCDHAAHATRNYVTGKDIPGRCEEPNKTGECRQYEARAGDGAAQ